TLIFNKAPYKNVIVLGHVQDENGQKMSKSKGNAVDPFDALESYGADAIRWYFYTNSAPWLPNRFHGKAVTEGQRKFMGTLWNTYAFYVLYANIDKFDPTKHTLKAENLTVMDKWLISKLNSMVKAVDDNLANYRIPEAARALQEFVDDMSNWYVRRGRERYWVQGMTSDKETAYLVLYNALVTTAKAAAPMIPFMSESIYQNLVKSVDKSAPQSIHLCDFPVVEENAIDATLEEKMDTLLQVVVLGRSARNGSAIKNRQPLNTMYVKCDEALEDYFTDIIKDELNIKNVSFSSDVDNFVSYLFKPQLKTVGPKYGKQLNDIRAALSNLDGNAAKAELDEKGEIVLDLASGKVILTVDDLLIEATQKSGFYTVSDRGITVAIDTELTPELIEEGFVREIVSKIQTMRKEAGFNVVDHISVTLSGSQKALDYAIKNTNNISGDTLTDSLSVSQPQGYVKTWDINGEELTIGVTKIQ
ncbi:MAG: DUF5915 domain-containing protein, partial [Acutalibacteraceae bacterium]|nr:DUF5915 domain-containing protein [Acutalibacteraceae bacterium]